MADEIGGCGGVKNLWATGYPALLALHGWVWNRFSRKNKTNKTCETRKGTGFPPQLFRVSPGFPVPPPHSPLDIVDILVLELDAVLVRALPLPAALVHLRRLRDLAVLLEVPCLLRGVLEDDVGLLVLEVAQPHQHDVPVVDPHLLAQLPADVAETLDAVEAHRVAAPVAEHFRDLRVFLAFLLENEFALIVLVVVLSSPSVLPSLSFVLRHGRSGGGLDWARVGWGGVGR
mmetsp:Transcript_16092/g.41353  ORF Transcript_16092/g.41353 Transcript_16092/m.41353 type:complete len:231 (+) Transcript_16092:141-833(+)